MLSLFVEPTIGGVNLVTERNLQKYELLWRSSKCFVRYNDSVPLNISVAFAKNRFCLKRLVTTIDTFRIGFVEDIDFRTAELDGIV